MIGRMRTRRTRTIGRTRIIRRIRTIRRMRMRMTRRMRMRMIISAFVDLLPLGKRRLRRWWRRGW